MQIAIRNIVHFLKYKKYIYAICIATATMIFLTYLFLLFLPVAHIERENSVEISIERGMTPQEIAVLLKEKKIIGKVQSFLWGAKLLGVTRKLQAGRYFFVGWITNYSVLRKLYKGYVITEQVTIPEGSRATKIAEILEKRFGINSKYFIELVNSKAFCRSLGIEAITLEGYLYPDTYYFQVDEKPEEIVKRMVSRFQEIFVDSLKERSHQLGMSVQQVVTLASIVEGEAVMDTERSIIAALYLNRLRRNMLLQADPTIQYIIQDGPRRLLTKDLTLESPYNTYIHSGLPPGPVNNPGIASILATLYPAKVEYLYMVANGDGSHTFSRTMSEHLKAKKRFDKIRHQVNHK